MSILSVEHTKKLLETEITAKLPQFLEVASMLVEPCKKYDKKI